MAITVGANARMAGMEATDGESEDVYLPGPDEHADAEGPFEFAYPRMGRILAVQRQMKSVTDAEAVIAASRAQMEWLAKGFGADAWAHILGRLDDPDDLLDDEHMQYLFVQLQKAQTGRPTTSSNGASRQPWKKSSTVAPSVSESVSEN